MGLQRGFTEGFTEEVYRGGLQRGFTEGVHRGGLQRGFTEGVHRWRTVFFDSSADTTPSTVTTVYRCSLSLLLCGA